MPRSGVRPTWQTTFEGEPAGEAVDLVAAGEVVVATFFFRNTVALDAADGSRRWERESTSPGSLLHPTVVEDAVVLSDADGLVAADLETGEDRWTLDLAPELRDFDPGATPAVVDGVAYLASSRGHLFAVDLSTRSVRWTTRVGDSAGRVVTAVGDRLFVTASVHEDGRVDHHEVLAVDRDSGEVEWRRPLEGSRPHPPAVDPQSAAVYLTFDDDSGRLTKLDAATGAVRWRRQAPELESDATPAVADGELLLVGDSAFVAVDAASGTAEVVCERRGYGATPLVAGDVALATDTGLFAVDLAARRRVWSFEPGPAITTEPAVVDGTIYLGVMLELGTYEVMALEPADQTD